MPSIEEAWRTFRQPLKQYASRRTGNPFAADDIVQDVFLRMILHLHTLKDERKMKSWLNQMTRNAIADYYRKAKRTDELPEHLPDREEEDGRNYNRELAACFRPFLERLPEKYRDALKLAEIEGVSTL